MIKHKDNIYVDGGLLSWLNTTGNSFIGDKSKDTNMLGLTKGGTSLATGIASGVTSLTSGLLNPSGNSTGVGNMMQSIGSIASAIPGVGGLIGSGINVLGGLTNAAFGSKINTQFVNSEKDAISQQSNTPVNAQSNEDLMNQWQNSNDLQHVSRSQVGSQGFLSHKASNLTSSLNNQIDKANYTKNLQFNNAANNIGTNTNQQLENNYYANGGFMPSRNMAHQIVQWEGKSMATNVPMAIKAREVAQITPNFDMLSQNQKDALFSYYYNVKPSTYKAQIVPLMSKLNYDMPQADRLYLLNQVSNNINTGINKPGYSGLTKRRLYEQNLFRGTPSSYSTDNYNYNDNISGNGIINTPEPQFTGGIASMTGNSGVSPVQEEVYQPLQDSQVSPFDAQFATSFDANAHVQPQVLADGGSLDSPANAYKQRLESNSAPIHKKGVLSPKAAVAAKKLTNDRNLLNNNDMYDPNYFSNGGSIYIKPENRGKFNATMERTGKTAHELLHSKNPKTRQRANFAINFGHVREDGGDIFADGGNLLFNMFAGGGGLSRQADYGSSKKPYPSVASSDFAGGGRSYPIPTHADAVDALRLAGLHGRDDVKAKVYAKYPDLKHSKASGGDLNNVDGGIFSNGVNTYNTGGSHEQNPNGGIPQGIASDGQPNLVEQGETKYNNYVYSNRNKPSAELMKVLGLKGSYGKDTFAKAANKISAESKERPNDPISQKGLKANMEKLQAAQELQNAVKAMQTQKAIQAQHAKANGGSVSPYMQGMNDIYAEYNTPLDQQIYPKYKTVPSNITNGLNNVSSTIPGIPSIVVPTGKINSTNAPMDTGTAIKDLGYSPLDTLRYAPAIGTGTQALTDILGITNKPDYTEANMVGKAINNIAPVSARGIGNYLTYSPLDTDYYLNQMNNQQASSRNALINNSGGNRANAVAGLLASDYNYNNNVGTLARQAQEQNMSNKMNVASFNRGTDEYNSDAALRAAMANQSNNSLKLQGTLSEAQLRQEANNYSSQARSANMTGFLNNLGNVGTDTYWRNTANSNPAFRYLLGANGNLIYKALGLDAEAAQAKAQETANNLKGK